MLQPISKD